MGWGKKYGTLIYYSHKLGILFPCILSTFPLKSQRSTVKSGISAPLRGPTCCQLMFTDVGSHSALSILLQLPYDS